MFRGIVDRIRSLRSPNHAGSSLPSSVEPHDSSRESTNEETIAHDDFEIARLEQRGAEIQQRLDEANRRYRDDPTTEHQEAAWALEEECAWHAAETLAAYRARWDRHPDP